MEHLIKMDDLGVYHYFQKHPDEDMQSADDGLVYDCSLWHSLTFDAVLWHSINDSYCNVFSRCNTE